VYFHGTESDCLIKRLFVDCLRPEFECRKEVLHVFSKDGVRLTEFLRVFPQDGVRLSQRSSSWIASGRSSSLKEVLRVFPQDGVRLS